jgi:carbonic anhydrase
MSGFPENLTDRFQRFRLRHFFPNAEQYEELARQGQAPEVMLISCCDSRVDPETIFSARPGELFVVRNVANLVPPYETGGKFHGVSAAIEFAVLNLHVKHIVIMGHSGCGGIKAVMDQSAAVESEAHFIRQWVSMLTDARPRVVAAHPLASESARLTLLELEGVKVSLRNLRTFPFVRERETKGKIALHGAHFDIATGTLSVLDQQMKEFVRL